MNNVNQFPEFLNVAPALQIWFRQPTLLTPKLVQTLNHNTIGPQVSFAVASWRLRIPSRISNFPNTRLSSQGKDMQNWKLLAAKRRGVIAGEPVNAMTYCISRAELFVLLLIFTTHQKGAQDGFKNADGGGQTKQKQHSNQPAQRSHNNTWRHTDVLHLKTAHPFLVNF